MLALSFPPHPETVFDEPTLRRLIACSRSLTLLEKLETIRGCASYSQAEIDGLINMLARERGAQLKERLATFERWTMEVSTREQTYASFKALLGGAPAYDALSPSAAAAALESASPVLLALLGMGDTHAVFEALLRRLAQQVRETGRAWMEGTVAELFAPEIAVAADRAGFVRKTINPALTKLRVNALEPHVMVEEQFYAVRLIVERQPDDPGRKKPLYRFTALVRRDAFHTRFERYRTGVAIGAVSLIEESRLEKIAHSLGVRDLVREALVHQSVENEEERKLVFYDLLRHVLGRLCQVLPAVEQQSLFASAFRFELRYDASAEPLFEDAFADAVVIPEYGPEDLSAEFFRDGLRVSRLFTFVDRLFLLHAYVFGSSRERFQLRTLVDVANFEYRREHKIVEASKLASPPDLRQILANHVNDVPAYFHMLAMDLRVEQHVRNALAMKSVTLHGVLRVARALEHP